MSTGNWPHTVFVSHAHFDNDWCDRYVDALRQRGLDVWYDRTNLQVGHSLSSDIEMELRSRTAFVVMVTPAALASQWVRSEIAAFRYLAAQEPARLFVPVRVAPCEMPLLWMDILWIDAVSIGFDAAIDALAKALRAPDPLLLASAPAGSLDDLVAHGEEQLNRGKFEEALATLEQALTLNPSSARAWYGKGSVLWQLNHHEEALAAYNQSLALDPRDAHVWNTKGNLLWQMRRYEEALAAHEQALKLDSTNVDAWLSKSVALRSLGHTAEADAALQRWQALVLNR